LENLRYLDRDNPYYEEQQKENGYDHVELADYALML
jgi:hypothetical protein